MSITAYSGLCFRFRFGGTEAECTDRSDGVVDAVILSGGPTAARQSPGAPRPHARLLDAVDPGHQHRLQVGDVAGGQSDRLDLRELSVGGFRGNQSPESGESRVDTMGSIPLASVRRLALVLQLRVAARRRWIAGRSGYGR